MDIVLYCLSNSAPLLLYKSSSRIAFYVPSSNIDTNNPVSLIYILKQFNRIFDIKGNAGSDKL